MAEKQFVMQATLATYLAACTTIPPGSSESMYTSARSLDSSSILLVKYHAQMNSAKPARPRKSSHAPCFTRCFTQAAPSVSWNPHSFKNPHE